jgi:hypothetical protein
MLRVHPLVHWRPAQHGDVLQARSQLWDSLSDGARAQFSAPPPGLPKGQGSELSSSEAQSTFGFLIVEPDAVRCLHHASRVHDYHPCEAGLGLCCIRLHAGLVYICLDICGESKSSQTYPCHNSVHKSQMQFTMQRCVYAARHHQMITSRSHAY